MAILEWLPCIATSCLPEDQFGIDKIYSTLPGGREWYMNMSDPRSDIIFDPRTAITKNVDGSWRVSGEDNGKYQVRMNVNTLPDQKPWLNVEITGYVRVAASFHPYPDHNALSWYARGGHHSDRMPCEGTSIKGRLHVGGYADWVKEIWHAGGYTSPLGIVNATDPIQGRWIGWKVAIYNINNTAVKMESYIDAYNNNTWTKASEVTDAGGWFASSSDTKFYSAKCGLPKDYVITNPGPIVTFRSDKIIWDFKNLSVREIVPPK